MSSPPLLPGCMVIWVDAFDALRTALVVQFNRLDTHYEATIVHDERIKMLILRHKDLDNSWRVATRER